MNSIEGHALCADQSVIQNALPYGKGWRPDSIYKGKDVKDYSCMLLCKITSMLVSS